MRAYLFIVALFVSLGISAQAQAIKKEGKDDINFDAIDSLYREDQFYLNITYNALQKRIEGINQNKLSPGIAFGFLRDMPINKKRTVSFAAGLGYTLAIYNQNLSITPSNEGNTYAVLNSADVSFTKNKLSFHFVDLPIEFRWRNSTADSHIFWRIYSGIKLSYLFYDEYKSVRSTGTVKISNNKDLNQFQSGAYLAFGWNTWTFSVYYGFNPLFKSSAKIGNQSLDMNTTNFGLMFYIL